MQTVDIKTYPNPTLLKPRIKDKTPIISPLISDFGQFLQNSSMENLLVLNGAKQENMLKTFHKAKNPLPSNLNEESKKITKPDIHQENNQKVRTKKQLWTPEEDEKLLKLYETNKHNWTVIANSLKTRSGKQVRDRYQNYLRPDIRSDAFTAQEDDIILTLYHKLGTKWSQISGRLSGRSELQVKNRFYAVLKKRMERAEKKPKKSSKKVEQESEEEDNVDPEGTEREFNVKEEPAKACIMAKMEEFNEPQQIIRSQNFSVKLENALVTKKEEVFSDSFTPSSGIFDSTETHSEEYHAENVTTPFPPSQINTLQTFTSQMTQFMRNSEDKLIKPIMNIPLPSSQINNLRSFVSPMPQFMEKLEDKLVKPAMSFMENPYIKSENMMEGPYLELQKAMAFKQRRQRYELLLKKKEIMELYYKDILLEMESLKRMGIGMEEEK